MQIPSDAVIPTEKLLNYLLVPRLHGDKSRFLAQAGFELDNAATLMKALRMLADSVEAREDGYNDYGVFLRQEGALVGPTGRTLPVVLIRLRWHLDGSVHFVTLKPRRE